MEKRLFIAIVISIGFLALWGLLMPRLFPELAKKPEQQQLAKPSTPPTATAAPTPTAPPVAAPAGVVPGAPVQRVAAAKAVHTVVDTPEYRATFSNRGAELVSFVLKRYKEKTGQPVELVAPRESSRIDYPFMIETAQAPVSTELNTALYVVEDKPTPAGRVIEFRYSSPTGVAASKTFTFTSGYRFDFSVRVSGLKSAYRVMTGPGIRTTDSQEKESQFIYTGNAIVELDGSFKSIAREKVPQFHVYPEKADFIGVEDNYFMSVLQPVQAGDAVLRSTELKSGSGKQQITRREAYAGFNSQNGTVAGHAFFGPKERSVLEQYGLSNAMKFGMFGAIARVLLVALIWINRYTHNYGWAIVVLTIVLKIVLYPLQHKSMVSMKKMQKLQPKVNALKDKYKKAKTDPDQRAKMNTEMMKLYQQEGANPMSGCFPILLQIPILWAFYGFLVHAIELRGAPFMLWITDLSAKDPYYITPILMTVTMFIQQAMTPSTADPVQKRMFMVMPIVLGWVFKEFPSGLVLYYFVQNVLTIIQQAIMNRYWQDHPIEPASGKVQK